MHEPDALPALFITADDYGVSDGTNAAIEALARQGRISAVSIMAHREARLDSVARLSDTGVSLGLHLCFSGISGLPANHRRLFAAILGRPSIMARLASEADEQAERLSSRGVIIDFCNAHEHAHLYPPLWNVFARLAERLKVRAVRAALGQRVGPTRAGLLSTASRVSWALRPIEQVSVLSPLGVGLAGALTLPAVAALLATPYAPARRRARELCVHPSDDARGNRSERELLASGALAELVARRGFRMAPGSALRSGG